MPKLKIVINLLPFRSYQGVETLIVNLIRELVPLLSKKDEIVVIKHNASPSWLNFRQEPIKNIIINFSRINRGTLALYQQLGFYALLKKIKPDVLFCGSPSAPFFYKNKVVIIHDCAYDRFPEFENIFSRIYFKLMYYSAKYFSKKIITISEFSKKELINFYKINPEKIRVIALGPPKLPDVNNYLIKKIKAKFNLNYPYFIYVGNTRPRKNIIGLLKAFKAFLIKKPNFLLVLVGKIDTRFLNLAEEIKKLDIGDKVIQTDFIPDEEKVALYKGATALTFPSYYEGFGLPVLEAQSLGIPVLTSDTSALPEVGGDAVLYIDPYNQESIVQGMEKLVVDKKLRANLINKGYENIKKFSWKKAARQLIEIFYENTSNK